MAVILSLVGLSIFVLLVVKFPLVASGVVSCIYILLIISPFFWCEGVCSGTDVNAWMPAFFFTPFGLAAIGRFRELYSERSDKDS